MPPPASGSTRLVVDIEPEGEPIRGKIWDGERAQPFEGWLQLISVLDGATERGHPHDYPTA